MRTVELSGVGIEAVYACVPAKSEDNLSRCTEVYGDANKALSVVKATGIKTRRVVEDGVSSLDLCVKAAESLLNDCGIKREEIGAVICVTFTPERSMPCNACQAQARLGLPNDIVAFDVNLACSGYAYGLYVAGNLSRALGCKTLLLDGDAQTQRMDKNDIATVPVLADAGTATLMSPAFAGDTWKFSFLSDGAKGEALALPIGGSIAMDGFAVFKFVTLNVLRFIQNFMSIIGKGAEDFDAFVPHQANIFMIQQISKKLKFDTDRLWISGDVLGNSSSASIPVTIAFCGKKQEARDRAILVSGFGGGLSAAVGSIVLHKECRFGMTEI